MAELITNEAASTIAMAAGVGSTETTITVADAATLGETANYRIVVDSELMLVTGVAGDDLTVTRGAEGTTATAHANGAAVTRVLTAGALGQYVSEAIVAAGAVVGAVVRRTTAQSVAANTYTAIDFDTEVFDRGGYHEGVAHPSRLTVPTGGAGVYLVTFGLAWAGSTSYSYWLFIRKNGTTEVLGMNTNTGYSSGETISGVVELADGDYIEGVVWQGSAGAVNTGVRAGVIPALSAVRLGS